MKHWYDIGDAITPIIKFYADVRRIIYHECNRESQFNIPKPQSSENRLPKRKALLKAQYLATFEVTKKWNLPIRNWGKVYGELSSMYEDRLPD